MFQLSHYVKEKPPPKRILKMQLDLCQLCQIPQKALHFYNYCPTSI